MVPAFEKLHVDVYARRKPFWGHHQKTQSMLYYCKLLFLCSVLIGTIYLVGNMGTIFQKLHIRVRAPHNPFWHHYQKTQYVIL